MTYYPGLDVKPPRQESYRGLEEATMAGQLSRRGIGPELRKMCFFLFMSPSTQALDDGAGKMMVVLYRSQGD